MTQSGGTSPAPADDVRRVDVTTPDGRVLHVHDDGEPGDERVPLVMHHGTPMSALPLGSQVEDAREKGIRLIAYDRPGYGGSTRQPGRRVCDAATDTATIADALGIERFVTAGGSGGGPHALACAALLPGRVAAAASVAGVAPYDAAGLDWLAGMGDDNLAEFGAAAAGAAELTAFLDEARSMILAGNAEELAEGMASLLPPADLRALEAGLGGWLHASMVAGLLPGIEGWLDDDLAFVTDWGFSLDTVRVPVLVVYGGQDLMVPKGHGAWLAENVPQASDDVDETAGHLSLWTDTSRLHAWLLARW